MDTAKSKTGVCRDYAPTAAVEVSRVMGTTTSMPVFVVSDIRRQDAAAQRHRSDIATGRGARAHADISER